jgi:uncharacterized YkwD family protein
MKKLFQTFCASTLLMTMIPMINAEASAKEQANVNYEQKANTTINWSTIKFNASDWSAYKEFIQKANATPSTKEEKQPVVSTTENKQQTTSTNQQTTSTNQQTTSNSTNTVSETDQSSNASASLSEIDAIEAKVVELTNAERAKNGLSPLQMDTQLMAAAREKSEDMKTNQYFSHTSPTFGSPFDRLKALGISYQSAGENIAKGQKTAEEVVEAWMNSEGHRANILDSNFTHIGVGYVKDGSIWTQQFIKK